MLKPLFFVLVIVTFIAGALNLDFFSNDTNTLVNESQPITKEPIHNNFSKNEIQKENFVDEIKLEQNLSKELHYLLHKATTLYQDSEDNEAHKFYDLVIEKSKDSEDPSILKLFAKACLGKAKLYYIYPNYDADSANEIYDIMITKLEKSTNKDLLLLYMDARIEQTQFIDKEESILIYDELIHKFQNDPEQRFSELVDELLFAKSFALMGLDDEEAMEVFDTIIAKYDKSQPLPDAVRYSILNNIELSIITNNNPDEYIDLAEKYMQDLPDTKPLLEMLAIIKNAQDMPQDEAIEKWAKEHQSYRLTEWNFSELRNWVHNMEHPEAQLRIKRYLDIFEQHKYQNYNQVLNTPIKYQTSSNEKADNTTQEEVYDYNDNELPVYSPEVYSEVNPYLNDIPEVEPYIYPDNGENSYEFTLAEESNIESPYQENY
jgi:hypothetical protein